MVSNIEADSLKSLQSDGNERACIQEFAYHIVKNTLNEEGRPDLVHYITRSLLRDFLVRANGAIMKDGDIGIKLVTIKNVRTDKWSYGAQERCSDPDWIIRWPDLVEALNVEQAEYRW